MITITDAAAKRIVDNIQKRGHGQGIKIGVKTTGCSGLAYILEYIDEVPNSQDWVEYQKEGAMIWIHSNDITYLKGLEIDYVRKGLNEGFEFRNPQEKARCGCGESFTI
jgi:iron-sulfur cluster assembly protein